ncbi:MAG TPA: hypothetical protein VEU62_20635 [Bryobacterales bacterium]|nr:hypothetical protein [Bryobacterales bacterium]
MKRNPRTIIAVVIFVVVALALIVYSTLSLGGYSCEVCMEFHRQSKCRTANGSTKEESTRTATDNACAFLASGVTDSIACTNTPPKSVRCEKSR